MAVAELEAALLADPEDAATFGVYIDALVAAGDPRGELAAIQQRRAEADTPELERAEAAALERNAEALLGKKLAGAHAKVRAGYVLGWSHGHLRSLEVCEPDGAKPTTGEILGELLAQPVARFLTSFALDPTNGQFGAYSYEQRRRRGRDVVSALAARPRPTLRSVSFGWRDIGFDTTGGEHETRDAVAQAGEQLGGLGRLWRAAPNLREVLISGGGVGLGAMDLPELRRLEYRQAHMTSHDLEALAAAKLPKLESLALWLGEDDYEIDYNDETLAPLCDPAKFPALRHLGLVCCASTDVVVGMLSRSPILPQLATLDLRGGTLSSPDAIGSAPFAHLAQIDLRWNALPAGTRIANALVDHQRGGVLQVRFNACRE